MTEIAPGRRTRPHGEPSPQAPERTSRLAGYGYVWRLWALVVIFSAVVLVRSAAIGVPVRDPGGAMFAGRLTKAVEVLVVIAVLDALVRAGRRAWSPREVAAKLRARWSNERIALILTGLVGYHVVYLGYRNMKSWNALNPLRDHDLLAADKALFLGHSPAVLLHDLLGTSVSADVLALAYRSFTYVVVLALISALALAPTVRKAYVFLTAATCAWVLGTVTYYVLPSLGPYASAPWEFSGLKHTAITDTQAGYLLERAQFLANPASPESFVSLGAFASLHVGFTTLVVLMARYYGLPRISLVLSGYLVLVVLATVYFGWHYAVDDLAGIALAATALLLGHWNSSPPGRRRDPAPAATRT